MEVTSCQRQAGMILQADTEMASFCTIGEALTITMLSIPAVWALRFSADQNLLAFMLALSIGVASAVGIFYPNTHTHLPKAATAPSTDVDAPTESTIRPEPNVGVSGAQDSAVGAGGDEKRSGEFFGGDDGIAVRENQRDGVVQSGGNGINPDVEQDPDTSKRRSREKAEDQLPSHSNTNNANVATVTSKRRPYRRGGEVLFIAEGVAEGVVGIVRDPLRGVQGEGARGLVKGIGSGVVGVVARPVRGLGRAGQNAYNGVRIGFARARGGTKGSLSSHSSKSSKEEASESNSHAPAVGQPSVKRNGNGSPSVTKAERPPPPRSRNRTVTRTPSGNGNSSANGEEVILTRQQSPFDGLVVGVSTVPLVVNAMFLLVLANQNRAAKIACGEVVQPMLANTCDSGECLAGELLLSVDGAVGSTAILGCPDISVGDNEGRLVMLGYLEAFLEGSILCAVSEVMFVMQKALQSERIPTTLSKLLVSGPFRLILLTVIFLWHCRRPLLPLWCLAIYDLSRRALDQSNGRATRALSLRPGEAAVLAHAVVLWTVDAALFTFQELWVTDSVAWEVLFPRVPARSGSMIIVQTGLLGTLVTGLALAGVRALMPASWSSDVLGHMLTYGIVIGGTAGWLERWTTPLLGSEPVTWTLLYAAGLRFSDRAFSRGVDHDSSGTKTGLSFSSGISVLFDRVLSRPAENNIEAEAAVFLPGMSVCRPLLVAGWVLVLVGVVPAVPWLVRHFELSKVEARKIFHGMATIMFVPAIALEPGFISLALGVAVGALLALEFLRCTGCPPLAGPLNRFFGEFLDSRDGGSLVATHLFLLLGCAIPLWLSGLLENPSLLPYTGVIIVGIGDAMGAVVGSRYGETKWPDSRRTLEGSAAVFSSSLAALVFVACSGMSAPTTGVDNTTIEGGTGWWNVCTRLAWPVVLASLAEAFTAQVDNLVLPCVLLSSFALLECSLEENVQKPSGGM